MNNINLYSGHRYPPEIISHAVWLYHRFTLSFRDIEEILALRGIEVSYESIRYWCLKFGNRYAKSIRSRAGRPGDAWYLDEVFLSIKGERHYLWRAVDQDGETLDILVQPRRDKRAAKRFFRKLMKGMRYAPRKIVTDKLRSYGAAHREMMPTVIHDQGKRKNNRAEVSHQPTRQQERQMRRFKSGAHAQQFLSVHAFINNLFRVGRHLLKAAHYRHFRERAFSVWSEVTCAQSMEMA
jgi:putative transposase